MFIFLVFVVVFSIFQHSACLNDVTNKVFGLDNRGILAAFGDFNSDKHTDIFLVSEDGSSVLVYLADPDEAFREILLVNMSKGPKSSPVISIIPADFDGDLYMDILLVQKSITTQSSGVSLTVYWGKASSVDQDSPLQLPDLVDQPLLLDENGDMIPDLFGEKSPGQRYYFVFSKKRSFTEKKFPGGGELGNHPHLRIPQSSAFVDMNNDLTADLFVVSMNETTQVEKWINVDGILTLEKTIPVTYHKQLNIIGQFVLEDLDGDLNVDILVPVCVDQNCEESLILLYYHGQWISLPVNFNYAGKKWNFIPPEQSGAPNNLYLPIALRVGDFNLDGYPDLLAVVGNTTSHLYRAVILYNEECKGGCAGFSRTFTVDWNTWLESSSYKALLPAFYDLNDDGILDIIVNSLDASDVPRINVLKHQFVDDACFIKVMVVSGLCNYDCPSGRKPYGVNQPGPVIRYETIDLHGKTQHRVGTQLTQSAYLPLQLPYIVFGLGQTPNFVDKLEVGIPTNTTTRRTQSWSSIIPNSQLVVIPYPINKPSSWTNKLFVTPSRLMLLTGAALLGTCGFIAGIVGILHWRDRVEDKKEKRQEAQKFHFDAM